MPVGWQVSEPAAGALEQSKEKTEFVNCTKDLGYSDTQIGYERGYDAQFGSFVKCGAIIINDVDDMVHAQRKADSECSMTSPCWQIRKNYWR